MRLLVIEDELPMRTALVETLKAKLEHDPTRPRHLLTVRGAGYRLVCGPDSETM